MTVARPAFAGLTVGAVLAALLVFAGVGALGTATHAVAANQRVTQLPPAARGPVAAALGAHQPAYQVHGLRALNHSQRLRASFAASGVTIHSGAGAVSLSLTSFGRGNQLVAVRQASPSSRANRVTYDRGPVREWYANGPLGLEQGFDVSRAPAGGNAPLRLSLALGGNLRPSLRGGTLRLEGHGASLGYGGLYVSDARGRRLPASLSLHGRRLTISVEDSHARYPLRIDPFVQQAELTPSDVVSGGYNPGMGSSVAMSADGSTIVAGAPFRSMEAPPNAPAQSDAVYVFTRPTSGWANATETAMLTPSSDGLELGYSVAVSPDGSTIVAGAPGDSGSTGSSFTGAAYVFERPGGGWANGTETAKLTSSDSAGRLGSSVAISADGNTIVAGAPNHSTGGIWDSQGALYVFAKPGPGWANATQTAELEGSDSSSSSALGSSVAISPSGDTIFGGADGQTVGSNVNEGAVYVYMKPGSGWANRDESTELTPGDGDAGDEFGYAVAATDDALAVGAPYHTNGSDPNTTNQGAAYAVVKPANGWTASPHATELSLADGMPNGAFGKAVAISGQTVAVGAPNEPYGPNIYQGLVYVARFTNDWSSLTFQQQVGANNGNDYAALGTGVGLAGDSLAAGAADTQVGDALHAGAVYEFGFVASNGGGGPTPSGGSGPGPAPMSSGSGPGLVTSSGGSGTHMAGGLGGHKSTDSVAGNGTVTLGNVTCSSPSTCAVHTTVTGTSRGHKKLIVSARKKKARKVTYGRAVAHVPAGKTRALRVKLSHAGMKALRKAHRLKVTVTLVITSPGQTKVTKTFSVTLKPAKAKKRHRH